MITLTFEPTNPEQAALLGQFLPQYMRAGQLVVSGEREQVKAVVEQAAEAVEEKPAAKKPRAAKPAAAVAPDSASATGTSETTSQAAPTATATTAETEQPAAASEAVTLEQVRAKLASLSQAGKAGDVKALISKFGAAKLTDVEPAKFGDLLAAAEELA